ncbi:MAG: hypothetical protein KatS3mg058_4429 [Roseiflexus sp.]|nr:MAG: hypothetical protein KatS3mg058_4429 [Roseiflexus sp.]
MLLGVLTAAADGAFGETCTVGGVSAGDAVSGTTTVASTAECDANVLAMS